MNKSPSISTITTTGTAYIHSERSCTITESRLDHMESLVERAKNFEKKTDKWNIFQTICSASGAIFLTLVSIFIPIWIGDMMPSKNLSFILYLALFISLITSILCFIFSKREQENRSTNQECCLTEIHNLIKKMQESFN